MLADCRQFGVVHLARASLQPARRFSSASFSLRDARVRGLRVLLRYLFRVKQHPISGRVDGMPGHVLQDIPAGISVVDQHGCPFIGNALSQSESFEQILLAYAALQKSMQPSVVEGASPGQSFRRDSQLLDVIAVPG